MIGSAMFEYYDGSSLRYEIWERNNCGLNSQCLNSQCLNSQCWRIREDHLGNCVLYTLHIIPSGWIHLSSYLFTVLLHYTSILIIINLLHFSVSTKNMNTYPFIKINYNYLLLFLLLLMRFSLMIVYSFGFLNGYYTLYY